MQDAQLDPRRKAVDNRSAHVKESAASPRTFHAGYPKEVPLATSDKESMASLPGSKTDKRKQSLYFPEAMLDEIQKEAQRLQRSMSWVVQRAWKHARKEIKSLPGSNEPES